jgi:hypothetical protein
MFSLSVIFAFGRFRRAQSGMRKVKILRPRKLNLPNTNLEYCGEKMFTTSATRLIVQTSRAHSLQFFTQNFRDLESLLYS